MNSKEMAGRILPAALLVFAFLSLCKPVLAWTEVGTGIEYQKFALPGPINVYVARMLRSELTATIESSLPKGKLTGAKERTSLSSNRLNDAINWWGKSWGKRNELVVAINGDWTYLTNGLMYSGQIHSGWYSKQIFCEFGGKQFAWTQSRVPYIGGNLNKATHSLTVTYAATGVAQAASGVNCVRNANELIVYTPQYDSDTHTDATGVEVLVELTQPTIAVPLPGSTTGIVRQIWKNQGSTPIPFDHVILSATGTAAQTLLANLSVGAKIGISQQLILKSDLPIDWSDVYASIGGGRAVVENGKAVDNSEDAVYRVRNPRTAVGYNATYLFFVVCDGRSSTSIGMRSSELSDFIIKVLKGSDALMLDSGGSSTMVVKGVVVNVPSDGSERAVGNGLMMVNLKPKLQSREFRSGTRLTTAKPSALRLGPGTNYAVLRPLTVGESGAVLKHALAGVFAKGDYWWKCDFNGSVGWVSEAMLQKR